MLSDQSKGTRAEGGDFVRERCRALGTDRLETDSYKRGQGVLGSVWPRDGQY